MPNRIKISTTQFKVSRPGFDVDTATADQLAFDAFGYRYSGVFLQGSSRMDDGTWQELVYIVPAGSFNQGIIYIVRRYKQISFNKTFATPPQVIYSVRQISAPNNGAIPRYAHVAGVGDNWSGVVVGAAASTTTLTLRSDWRQFDQTGGITADWEFSYVVFQA